MFRRLWRINRQKMLKFRIFFTRKFPRVTNLGLNSIRFFCRKINFPFQETKSNGDPVKFIPENAYSQTETTVIHVIQPTQFGPDRDFCHQTVLFQNSQEIFCIKCREVHRTKTLRANHSSFRSDIFKVYSNHLIYYFSWMLCFFMFLFGCWPCCAIPFCIGSLKGTLS